MTEDWLIGFFWGVGAYSNKNGGFVIKNKNLALLEEIAVMLKVQTRPKEFFTYRTDKKTISSYRLYFTSENFSNRVHSLGWTGRFDKERIFPKGDIDKLEFIRGYCHTKLSVKRAKNKWGFYTALMIYGSFNIVETIDKFLANYFDMAYKTVQMARNTKQNGSCHYVAYQAKEITPQILMLLKD